MKLYDMKCPNCSGSLNEIDSSNICTCPYCNTKIYVELSNDELRLRTLKSMQDFEIVKMKLEAEEKEKEFQRNEKSFNKTMLYFALPFICLIIMYIVNTIKEFLM